MIKYSNNAATTLSAAINGTQTSITVADASIFPALGFGDELRLTIANLTNTDWEIVKATAVSGNTLTVTRGQEGTTAKSWASGSPASLRITAGGMDAKVDGSQVLTNVPANALFTDTVYTLPASVVHDTEKGALHATDALRISGHTVSLYKGDGTSESVVIPDNNTTYTVGDGGLTQKNFTTTLKNKLDGIDTDANKYVLPASVIHQTELSSSTSSTSTTVAANSAAVKAAYDKGNHSHPYAPSSHSHDYAATSHTHSTYAPKASPTFTGTITSAGTISTAGGSHTFNTQYGNIQLGPMNSSHAHIYTNLSNFYFNRTSLFAAGNTIWHAGNDGSGSGLDADLLDGQQGSSYLLKSGGTMTGNLTLSATNPQIDFNGTSDAGVDMAIKATPEGLDFIEPEQGNKIHFQILDDAGVNAPYGYKVGATVVIDTDAKIDSGRIKNVPSSWTANTTYTATQMLDAVKTVDGSGSGLDADLLDGQHASAFATSGHAHTYASFGVSNGTPTTGKGISLYGGASPGEPTYGLMFAGTGTFGTHGNVSADWATYFTMNSTANRGWIFRNVTAGNVASINNAGHATFNGGLTANGGTVWTSTNDGSGSGLDADTVDGIQGSSFLHKTAGNQTINGDHSTARLQIRRTDTSANMHSYLSLWASEPGITHDGAGIGGNIANAGYYYGVENTAVGKGALMRFYQGKVYWVSVSAVAGTTSVKTSTMTLTDTGSLSTAVQGTVWGSSNDGSGSGLDADLLDGMNSSASGGANKILASHASNGYLYINNWIHPANGTGLFYDAGVHFHESGNNMYSTTGLSSANQGYLWGATNDGSGSGLDADLLDGQQGSYYMPASTSTIQQANFISGSAFSTSAAPDNVLEYAQASSITDTKVAPSTDWYNSIRMGHGDPYSYYSNTLAIRMTGSGVGTIYTQTIINNNAQGWNKHWHSNNDGSGSGLDADLLDGQQASAFATSGHSHNYVTDNGYQLRLSSSNEVELFNGSGTLVDMYLQYSGGVNSLRGPAGSIIWHAGNDGSGSGLDADLLDGLNSTAYMRDDGWNNSPGQDANTQSGMSSDFTYSNNAPNTGDLIRFGAGGYSLQLSSQYGGNGVGLNFRTRNGDAGSWNSWHKIFHSGNDGSGSGLDADTVDGLHASQIGFPSGTKMLFQQTSAPTGWTKQTSHNNKALRVVTGSVSSGGSSPFTTAFGSPAVSGSVSISGSVAVNNTTLSTNQIPSHFHYGFANGSVTNLSANTYPLAGYNYGSNWNYSVRGNTNPTSFSGKTSSTGGGGGHNHGTTSNMSGSLSSATAGINVQYVDVIIASKN